MSSFDFVILGAFDIGKFSFPIWLPLTNLYNENVRAIAHSTYGEDCWDAASYTENLVDFVQPRAPFKELSFIAIVGHRADDSHVWLTADYRISIQNHPFRPARVFFYTCGSLPAGTTGITRVTDFVNRIDPANASEKRDKALDGLKMRADTMARQALSMHHVDIYTLREQNGFFTVAKETGQSSHVFMKMMNDALGEKQLKLEAHSLIMQTTPSAQGDMALMLTHFIQQLHHQYGIYLFAHVGLHTPMELGWSPHLTPYKIPCIQIQTDFVKVADLIEELDANLLANDNDAPCRLRVKNYCIHPYVNSPEPWMFREQMNALLPCYREAHKYFDNHSNMTGLTFGFKRLPELGVWDNKELRIIVLVVQKGFVPMDEEEFPSDITCAGITVKVSVEEGTVRWCGGKKRDPNNRALALPDYREFTQGLKPGSSIGVKNDVFTLCGTLGGFVVADQALYGLTNAHVIALNCDVPSHMKVVAQEKVYYPSTEDLVDNPEKKKRQEVVGNATVSWILENGWCEELGCYVGMDAAFVRVAVNTMKSGVNVTPAFMGKFRNVMYDPRVLGIHEYMQLTEDNDTVIMLSRTGQREGSLLHSWMSSRHFHHGNRQFNFVDDGVKVVKPFQCLCNDNKVADMKSPIMAFQYQIRFDLKPTKGDSGSVVYFVDKREDNTPRKTDPSKWTARPFGLFHSNIFPGDMVCSLCSPLSVVLAHFGDLLGSPIRFAKSDDYAYSTQSTTIFGFLGKTFHRVFG